MAKRFFGTDGIRGIANQKLTPELCFQIGQAAGRLMPEPKRIVIGADTRKSGPMLAAALAAGAASVGVDVIDLGVVPTGGISFIARTGDFSLGVVISASHNPAPDNGVKLIGHDGRKVSDEFEEQIEALFDQSPELRPIGDKVGTISHSRSEIEHYMEALEAMVPERLEGMKLVVDGAHGAGFELGAEIFRRLGAEVIAMGCEPDGMNINEHGGATKPENVQQATVEHNADLGIAFDGDADRAVFSDRKGRLINGDRTMAIWSSIWRAEGQFDPPIIVGTVMSNGGFEHFAKNSGIELVRASVGDKYVAAKMRELGAKVGGEQSGHIIFADRGPTGDGLITALELLRAIKRSGKSADEHFDSFENWPQVLFNVEVERKDGWEVNQGIKDAINQAETLLGDEGRINVRASGTQPMIRVMAEASSAAVRDQAAQAVVSVMLSELGGRIYSQVDLTNALGD